MERNSRILKDKQKLDQPKEEPDEDLPFFGSSPSDPQPPPLKSLEKTTAEGTTTAEEEEEIEETVSDMESDFEINFIKKSTQIRNKYISKLMQHQVLLPDSQKPVSNQTIIIFDWDDTILPTTFLNPGGIPDSVALNTTVRAQLKKLEGVASKILARCLEVGKVFIITNAAEGWVEFSTRKYLPKLKKVIAEMHIISARTKFEEMFPNEYHQWKMHAFLETLDVLELGAITNLIALGDSHMELDAA